MSYIGLPPKANFTSGLLDRFTSTTGTTVTLTHDIASENDIVVFVNFVKQDSTTYSVGGTGNKTLTLGGTLVSSDIVEVHYLNIVGQTVAPSSGSVGSSQLTADLITGQTAESSIATDDTILIHDTSASALRKMTRANFVSGIGGTNTPNFFAYVNANQTVNNNTDTKVGFNTESFDTASAYDHSSNFRFTIPSGQGGKYSLTAQILLYDSNGNLQGIRPKIFKNGSIVSEALWDKESGGSKYWYNYSSNINILLNLSASDYIEIFVRGYTTDSGSFVINGHSSEIYSFFTGYKIIE